MLVVIMVSSLLGSGVWLLVATFFKAPLSTTHSIVAGIISTGLVLKGSGCIHLDRVTNVIVGWLVSPVIGGIVAVIVYVFVDHSILRTDSRLPGRFFRRLCVITRQFKFFKMLSATTQGENISGGRQESHHSPVITTGTKLQVKPQRDTLVLENFGKSTWKAGCIFSTSTHVSCSIPPFSLW